jgi:hypothetical protein
VLPGDVTSSRPLTPYFLQCWLARSGSLPLTLRIADNTPCLSRFCAHRYNPSRITATNSQLLDIFSESKRWQTVVMPPKCNWGMNFDTPQLRALERCFLDLSQFYAPNISFLYINTHCFLVSLTKGTIPTSSHVDVTPFWSTISSVPGIINGVLQSNVCNQLLMWGHPHHVTKIPS